MFEWLMTLLSVIVLLGVFGGMIAYMDYVMKYYCSTDDDPKMGFTQWLKWSLRMQIQEIGDS